MKHLTEIQLETLRLLAEGLTDKGIAARRNVNERTVESTLRRIYQELGLTAPHRARRIQAVNMLRNHEIGLLESRIAQYKTALQWASAAPAFQEEGEAREGWLKVVKPLLKRRDFINSTTCYCRVCQDGCVMCGLGYHADDVDREHYGRDND